MRIGAPGASGLARADLTDEMYHRGMRTHGRKHMLTIRIVVLSLVAGWLATGCASSGSRMNPQDAGDRELSEETKALLKLPMPRGRGDFQVP